MSSNLLAISERVWVCPVDTGQKWQVVGPILLAFYLLARGQIAAKMEELLLSGNTKSDGQIVLYRLSPPLFRSDAEAELQRIRTLCGELSKDIILAPV